MKVAVIVFSTHLKIESLLSFQPEVNGCEKVVFFTPQYLFPNERNMLDSTFRHTEYVCFADVMTDNDGESCDFECFLPYQERQRLQLKDMYSYFNDIKKKKNEILVNKVEDIYHPSVKLIASDDLGILLSVWEKSGYKRIVGEYYYVKEKNLTNKILRKDILTAIARKYCLNFPRNVYVAYFKDKKILFHGHLERAGYRMDLMFEKNSWEAFKHWIVKLLYVILKIRIDRKQIINLTTSHEYGNYTYYDMPDIPEFHNYIFQDGYLPSNDTCKYLFFYGRFTKFLTWDKLGDKCFEYHNIQSQIIPCRKCYPMPKPIFRPIKKVLCVSSGAGDWTAIKNRSDEDKTAAAFLEMARRFPQIEFVYRCHPSWIGSAMQGVNSIQRLATFFESTGLPNIYVSSNIPSFYDEDGHAVVSHKKSSLEEDLNGTDFVFGVHSISMIDAALKQIPFSSVNLSGRRNLWKSITDLGFPHCEDIESIAVILRSTLEKDFQNNYLKAVSNYNIIINEE